MLLAEELRHWLASFVTARLFASRRPRDTKTRSGSFGRTPSRAELQVSKRSIGPTFSSCSKVFGPSQTVFPIFKYEHVIVAGLDDN